MRAQTWIWIAAVCGAAAGLVGACASPDASRYRLAQSGAEWRRAGDDPVLADLRPRYPDFFAQVLDPAWTEDFDILPLREDLESGVADRRRFDSLNAVAVAYFELNSRAQRGLSDPSGGAHYLSDSFRAAKLLSIPWRAYANVDDPRLRDAIVDFFEDVARGGKRDARETAPRVARTLSSLERKEDDPARRDRIRRIGEVLSAR